MDQLPRDVIEKMSMELPSKDLLNLCVSQSRDGNIRKLCQNDQFWMRRFQKDFPTLYEILLSKKLKTSWKQDYLFVIKEISMASETATEYVLDSFGVNKGRFLQPTYERHLLDVFYDLAFKSIVWYSDNLSEYNEREVERWHTTWMIDFGMQDENSDLNNQIIVDANYGEEYPWREDLTSLMANPIKNIIDELLTR